MDIDALIAAALAPYVPFLSAADLAWMADRLRETAAGAGTPFGHPTPKVTQTMENTTNS